MIERRSAASPHRASVQRSRATLSYGDASSSNALLVLLLLARQRHPRPNIKNRAQNIPLMAGQANSMAG